MVVVEGLNWRQFSSLPHIARLPLNRQISEYDSYNQQMLAEAIARQQYNNANDTHAVGSGKRVIQQEEEIPAGCIQFVVNTTEGTFFEVSFRSNTNDFTYTVNWGDGETGEGSSGEGYVLLDHTYPDGVADYTVRVCFDDTSIIHDIDFPGFD